MSEAWDRARVASADAGVEIRSLETLEDADEAIRVMVETWGPYQIPPREMLHAMRYAGCPFHGAFRGGEMLGFSIGFYGTDEDGFHLHSHMLAVLPEVRSRGVGYALKLAQAAAVLDAGVARIRWTFDPLVAKNARFNLTKLGAVADSFQREFYGPMEDLLNRGDRTDRLVARWDLGVAGRKALGVIGSSLVVLEAAGDERSPVPVRAGDPVSGRPASVRIPRDHATLRRADPGPGEAWREAVARAMEDCFAAGLVAGGFTEDVGYLFVPEN